MKAPVPNFQSSRWSRRNPLGVTSSPTPYRVPRGWRWVISFLVSLHLLAVFAEPFRFFTRSSQRVYSPEAGLLRDAMTPWIDFAYLHHGYFFFAPNPGPSHLIQCRIDVGRASERSYLIPDKFVLQPRLYNHRHFMLSEFLHNSFTPPESPNPQLDPIAYADWQRAREFYTRLQGSIVEHLKDTTGSNSVEIRRIEHLLPNDLQVYGERMRLNDPRLYVTLPESLPVGPLVQETIAPLNNLPLGPVRVAAPNATEAVPPLRPTNESDPPKPNPSSNVSSSEGQR